MWSMKLYEYIDFFNSKLYKNVIDLEGWRTNKLVLWDNALHMIWACLKIIFCVFKYMIGNYISKIVGDFIKRQTKVSFIFINDSLS